VGFICDESLKFENVQISKSTVHCGELPPQDGTPAVYLTCGVSHPGFRVNRQSWSYSWLTPVPVEFAAGPRLFWLKRTVGFGGLCTP